MILLCLLCSILFLFQVCFKHAIFALLPRMIYGLYYNTPLVSNNDHGLYHSVTARLT